jgi:hypothetical protein
MRLSRPRMTFVTLSLLRRLASDREFRAVDPTLSGHAGIERGVTQRESMGATRLQPLLCSSEQPGVRARPHQAAERTHVSLARQRVCGPIVAGPAAHLVGDDSNSGGPAPLLAVFSGSTAGPALSPALRTRRRTRTRPRPRRRVACESRAGLLLHPASAAVGRRPPTPDPLLG